MAYEKIIQQGSDYISVKVMKDHILLRITAVDKNNPSMTGFAESRMTPEHAEKLQEALDTALCYFGERKTV